MTDILAVNAGSSTVKLDRLAADGDVVERMAHRTMAIDADTPAASIGRFLAASGGREPKATVHRIVHGGAGLTAAAIGDERVVAAIQAAVPLAPLHNRRGLDWLAAAEAAMPQAKQIVIPDTGFFADLPPEAARYALPRSLADELGIRRYGFHGIAHQSMLHAWSGGSGTGGTRVITIQLGSGCSIAAIRGGKPIDTSMGFTPLEGLVMATRSGDIDAGIIFHLIRERGLSADELDRLLNHESGLLGLAGSADMRDLLASDSEEAREALDIYCYRVAKFAGAYLVALGGVDAILFGGGVGEHSAEIRGRILGRLAFAGINIDSNANRVADTRPGRFHAPGSSAELHVIAVDEATQMVRLAGPLLS